MREARPSSLTPSNAALAAQRRLEHGVKPDGRRIVSPNGSVSADRPVAERVLATAVKTLQPHVPVNPWGRHLTPARHGAKGMAGMRADLMDGSLTLLQLRTMSLRQIAERYQTSKTTAMDNKRYLLAWGLGGSKRLPGGARRPGTGEGRGGSGQDQT